MNNTPKQDDSSVKRIGKKLSQWAELKNLLQKKGSLESSVNLLRTKTIEQFASECLKIYKKKIKIQYLLQNNREIIGNNLKEVKFTIPSIEMKDGSTNFTYYDEVEKFLFTFRSNNYLMLNLIESLKPDQWEIMAPFLCHFFYENFYSESTEQEEILYIIYLLLEKEIDALNTPSLYSFLDSGFLSIFLTEFSNRYEIKCYINEVINTLIQNLESSENIFYSLDIFSSTKSTQVIKKDQSFLRQSTVDVFKNKNFQFDNEPINFRASEAGFMQNRNSFNPFSTKPETNISSNLSGTDKLHSDTKISLTENDLRIKFEDESQGEQVKKEFLIKQLRFLRSSKNKLLFSNSNFLENFRNKKTISDDKIIKYNNGINMIKSFIASLFKKLVNDAIIPYSLKCICKMIYILIKKKFKDISDLDRNTFVCEFFFGKLILPVLLNPDINELGSKMIISLSTRKNCYNIYLILKNYVRGEFFTSENNKHLTVFNNFILEGVTIIDKLIGSLINVSLPPKLERLASEFYGDESFILDNSNRDRNLIDYDYFEENPNDFMQHQSICFKIEELVEIMRAVSDNKEKFVIPDEPDFQVLLKWVVDFKEDFETKVKNQKGNQYFVIINDIYTPEKRELLNTKDKTIPLPANPEKGCINEIKYSISILLSEMELRPHSEWVTNEKIKTTDCFEAIYQITKCYEQQNNLKRVAPLSWYALYITNNLENLPSNYKENDYALLYSELYKETQNKMDSLKEVNDFLTIQITAKFSCLKQKIKITKDTLEKIRQAELNIRTLKFMEKTEINVCVITRQEYCRLDSKKEKEKSKIEKRCPVELIIERQENCIHNSFQSPNEPEIGHLQTIQEFAEFFANLEDVQKEIENGTQSNQTKAKELLDKYMEIVFEEAKKTTTFQYSNEDTPKTLNGFVIDERDSYLENNIDFARDTIVPENKPQPVNQNELYLKKAMNSIKNYILKEFCAKQYEKEPIFDDFQFWVSCSKYGWIDPVKNLDLPIRVFDENIFQMIKAHLKNVDILKTPEEKLEEIGVAVQMINSLYGFTTNKDRAEAGDLLPFIIYGIIMARPTRFRWSCSFIRYFMNENEKFGNTGYNLIQIESSIDFIKKIEGKTLHMSTEEFSDQCLKYASSLDDN